MNIGTHLKKMRNVIGLTQSQVAEKMGISQISIQRYERDERKPNFETLYKLSRFYGCSVDELITGEGNDDEFYMEDIEEKISELHLIAHITEKQLLDKNATMNDLLYQKGYYDAINQALQVMED